MSTPFVHLHVHSYYSMMRGVNSPEDLCKRAAELGFEHIALTDTNGMYGLVNFLDAARRYGIRPIVGAQVRPCVRAGDGETRGTGEACGAGGSGGAVLLAKTARGYELLANLLSRRHLDRDFQLASAFPDSAFEDLALLSSDAHLLQTLRSRAECLVEVVPGPSDRDTLAMAGELGIPPVATNAVHFIHPGDHALHRLARAIDLNKTLSTIPPHEVVGPERRLKAARDMALHFPNRPEALSNAWKLAARCRMDWDDRFRTVFPRYDRHDYCAGNRPGAADNSDDDVRAGGGVDAGHDGHSTLRLLEERCRAGIRWRYGETNPAVDARLCEELELIRSKGYVDYFLVVADIVGRRRIHCGRGSGAASLVSYLLGITHVDPIRHNLLFGRFLNPRRKDPPDIDVDFPWDERDGLMEELRGHYGPERLATVSNHVGFGARAAVRETAKVYGMPASEIKGVTSRMSSYTHPGRMWDRVKTHPKCRGMELHPPWPEILDLAARLESLPRHLSTHCGGVILVPDRITRYVPVQRNAKGARIIQWEKDQAEKAGLVKIDLLGNRSLAVIRDTLEAIGRNTGNAPDYATLNPVDDPAALDLLARGDSMGVFYVESPAMRQLQKKTGRADFEHLVINSSIIRPAANRYIREYVERVHGVPYRPIHPRVEAILAETYGILVYQEHVVQTAMALAGFDWGEADGLRKIISKKSRDKIEDYRRKFHAGCAREGVPASVAGQVWDMFLSFAGYSFCKPHSASYALVSFKSAYLKAHYPAEFMAAVISNGGGYYSTFAYISEARRMGITVLGPDVNESEWAYEGRSARCAGGGGSGDGNTGSDGNGDSGNRGGGNGEGGNGIIRMGFQQLQNIRGDTLKALLGERSAGGPFTSLEDFLARAPLDPSDGRVLVKSGALDSLAGGLNRPQLLWTVEARLRARSNANTVKPPIHSVLEEGRRGVRACKHHFLKVSVPPLPDLSPRRTWRQEAETLGFVLSVHPLAMYGPEFEKFRGRITPAADLPRHVGRSVWVKGRLITRKETITKRGSPMEFVSFEDETAIYEAVFFPDAFRRFCRELDYSKAYLLQGKVESEFGAVSLTVHRMIRVRLPTA